MFVLRKNFIVFYAFASYEIKWNKLCEMAVFMGGKYKEKPSENWEKNIII